MSKQTDFIAKVAAGAQQGWKKCHVLASLSIAQAILESGWGGHAPGNNLFGIKANGTKGATQKLLTREVVNGKSVYIYADFRAYASMTDSIADHAAFLAQNKRYTNLLGATNYKTVCTLIFKDGYATDPTYTKQLIMLIEQYKLYQYDTVTAQQKKAA